MFKLKKTLLLFVIIVLSISIVGTFSLIGCKTTAVEETVEEAQEEVADESEEVIDEVVEEEEVAEPVTLTLWDWQSGVGLGELWDELAAEFAKTHPGFAVDRKEFTYGDYNSALKTALAAGDAPDIFEVHPGPTSIDLVDGGTMLDLTDAITGDAEWSEWIAPALALKDMYLGDKIYYVPMDVNHLPLNYWKEMFEERNLTPPTTITELIAVSEVFLAEGITPIATGYADLWALTDMFTSLVRSADKSGDLIDRANIGEASWEDPIFKQALQTMADLTSAGILPKNVLEIAPFVEGMEMFVNKEAAMIWPIGQYGLSDLPIEARENDEIWDIPFPALTDDGTPAYTGGASITVAISPDSENIEIAIEFLKLMNSAFGQEVVFDSMRTPPGGLVSKEGATKLFERQTWDQNNTEIRYRYVDNPDISAVVISSIQEALLGGDIDALLAKIEAVSQEVNG